MADAEASAALQGVYRPQGYYRLANMMVRDRRLAIFRRFDDLAILNILSLQAELIELRDALYFKCERDADSQDVEERKYSKSFQKLREDVSAGSQRALLEQIRAVLEKYRMQCLLVICSSLLTSGCRVRFTSRSVLFSSGFWQVPVVDSTYAQ